MNFWRWLFNITLALLGVAILFTFPAAAEAEDGCLPLETIKTQIEYAPSFRILDGERRVRAWAVFNALTGSEIDWQSAYVLTRPDGLVVLLVGFQDTICDGLVVADLDSAKRLLEIIDGISA